MENESIIQNGHQNDMDSLERDVPSRVCVVKRDVRYWGHIANMHGTLGTMKMLPKGSIRAR